MNGEDPGERAEAPPADPESAVKLRGDPPRVMRLSRKAIGIASACGFALVGGTLIYALQPAGRRGAEELYTTDGVAVADNLAGAPKDYGQVPKLGPPLPGDLGKPILDAQRRGDVAALPPVGAQSPAVPVNPAIAAAREFKQSVNDLNASITYTLDMGLEFSIWGRNLLDDRMIRQIFDSPAQIGSISGYPNQPRTYGASVRYKF